MKNLSKSKLLAYDQCPKRLWLEVHKPAEKQDSAQTLASYATGNIVGELAQKLYDETGKGTLIDPFKEGWPSAFRRTTELLNGNEPIFEATFSGAGVLALADVMLPAGGGAWNMLEVKSSTSVKDYHRLDVAVQMYAANAAGIN
jgi:CRISPR/Cas system-associated exonuclease Cas4 (RecB family)